MLPLPDLLYQNAHAPEDTELLAELLEKAFIGGDTTGRLEDEMQKVGGLDTSWQEEFFAQDLYVQEFVDGCLTLELLGQPYPVHRKFLRRVLVAPPADLETVRFRQSILRELDDNEEILQATETLAQQLFGLLAFLKTPDKWTRLDHLTLRLDTLEQAKTVIDLMVSEFETARSGLVRLHQVGLELQASSEYQTLSDLLDYENHLATMKLEVRVGADGRLRTLAISDVEENERNRFYRSPVERWKDLLRLWFRRYSFDAKELLQRVVMRVFEAVSPAIQNLLQTLGQLEVYLTARSFRKLAASRGLEVSLAEVALDGPLNADQLFNPLLLRGGARPVPTQLATRAGSSINIITGPNSGGKTRGLQAIGLAQMLGQSGLYAPFRRGQLPLVSGLFVSLIQHEDADQTEGRLGREMLRVRNLFQSSNPGSLVLLDELCSGTNPSEAIEIFTMVVRLLHRIAPTAFITTHFLDYAQQLAEEAAPQKAASDRDEPALTELEFLQVEVDEEQNSTYQFIPGVAPTSLAAGTAQRLGVTFNELSRMLDERIAGRQTAEQDTASEPGKTKRPSIATPTRS